MIVMSTMLKNKMTNLKMAMIQMIVTKTWKKMKVTVKMGRVKMTNLGTLKVKKKKMMMMNEEIRGTIYS